MNVAYVFVAICCWLCLAIWACNFPSIRRKAEEQEARYKKDIYYQEYKRQEYKRQIR